MRGPNNKAIDKILENSNKKASLIQMDKTNHVDFSISYMFSPLTKYIGFTGKLDGRKSSRIQEQIILSFFDSNLRNQGDNKRETVKEIVDEYDVLSFK